MTERQFAVDAVGHGGEPQLRQPVPLAYHELGVVEVLVCLPPP